MSWEKRRGPTMRDIWSSRKEVTQKEEREEASVVMRRLPYPTETVLSTKVSEILELGNVWVFVQLIDRPTRTKNQLYKNQNIA